jgi:hypothetical protein
MKVIFPVRVSLNNEENWITAHKAFILQINAVSMIASKSKKSMAAFSPINLGLVYPYIKLAEEKRLITALLKVSECMEIKWISTE